MALSKNKQGLIAVGALLAIAGTVYLLTRKKPMSKEDTLKAIIAFPESKLDSASFQEYMAALGEDYLADWLEALQAGSTKFVHKNIVYTVAGGRAILN